MIRKYRYGTPFNTEALTEKIETTEGVLPYGEVSQEEGLNGVPYLYFLIISLSPDVYNIIRMLHIGSE